MTGTFFSYYLLVLLESYYFTGPVNNDVSESLVTHQSEYTTSTLQVLRSFSLIPFSKKIPVTNTLL